MTLRLYTLHELVPFEAKVFSFKKTLASNSVWETHSRRTLRVPALDAERRGRRSQTEFGNESKKPSFFKKLGFSPRICTSDFFLDTVGLQDSRTIDYATADKPLWNKRPLYRHHKLKTPFRIRCMN